VFHLEDLSGSERDFIKNTVTAGVKRLKNWGVKVGNPVRPLHIVSREWAPGYDANSPSNPFWSHYDPLEHTVQIAPNSRNKPDTMFHEIGHAICGTEPIFIPTGYYADHNLTDTSSEPIALNEGWADFVALALTHDRASDNPDYGRRNLEERNLAIPKKDTIEYNVAAILWDLFDTRRDEEEVALNFGALFRVFSPSLEARQGPAILLGVRDFLDRLKAQNPRSAQQIDRVASLHISQTIKQSALIGGAGGVAFQDDLTNIKRLASVAIRSGLLIDAIRADFLLQNGSTLAGASHGGSGGSEAVFNLAEGEVIVSIEGQHTGSIICQLSFRTSSGAIHRFGTPGPLWIDVPQSNRVTIAPGATVQVPWNGSVVSSVVPADVCVGAVLSIAGVGNFLVAGENQFRFAGYEVVGFHGRSGALLDAIGFQFR
jgi:hypothetical protein